MGRHPHGGEPAAGPSDPYHADYFASVYRGSGENGRSAQTWIDRVRDRQVAHLARRFGLNGRARPALLDVGCGYGYLLERLRGRFDLHGIDVSEHAIIESRRRLPEGAVEQADVQEAIPFPGPFQAVLAVNVIEHLLDPEAAVRNIRDVLAPGGVAIIHVPTIDNSISRLIYRLSYERDPTHAYRPSAAAVRDLFASLGLRLLWDSQYPHVPRWLWNTLRWHPAHLAIYRRDRGVGRPVVSRR